MKFFIAVVAILLMSSPLRASGPGTHIFESDAVLDTLAAEDPEWAALADLPYARAYLGFGAVSPDFRSACAEMDFGHQKSLSYHLLALAEEEKPEFRLFALGHLCHQGTDNAMEGLMVAAFFSSAPAEVFSLFGEYLDGRGDSEAIVETMGDLIFGDWHGLVDMLFDMWFEDEAAKARSLEVFQWYCGVGAAYLGKDTDCALAQAQLEDKLAQAEGLIGLLDREAAHDLVDMLVSQPLEDIVDLAGSGLLTSLLAGEYEESPDFDAEIERLKDSPLTDPAFWDLYYDLDHLGPAFTLAQLEHQPPTGAWPVYDKEMVICGNIQTVMRHLPEDYAVVTGLSVDRVEWLGPDGEPVAAVTPDLVGETLTARVRFFSALPFAGTVTGVVRRDAPGFGAEDDTTLGTASVEVDIDPAAYVTTPRSELEIPFIATAGGALGFYLELTADEEPRPWFTTSWDRLWGVDDLYFARPIYMDNFGTYGHWPPSLPVETPDSGGASVFVQVRVAPAGPGIGDAAVMLFDGAGPAAWEGLSAANGLAVIDWMEPGEYQLGVAAEGYVDEPFPGILVDAWADQWHVIALHAVPEVQVPEVWDSGECIPVTWDAELFAGQAEVLTLSPLDAVTEEPSGGAVELPPTGEGEYCFDEPPPDGAVVRFQAVATYLDGSQGVEGFGSEVLLDGSSPVLTLELVGFEDDPCIEASTTGILAHAEDPHTYLVALAWSVDGGDWMEVPPETDESGHVILANFQAGAYAGAEIRMRVSNAAGLETISDSVAVPAPVAWCGVPEPDPDTAPEPAPDVVDATPDAVDVEADLIATEGPVKRDRGCGMTDTPANPLALLVLVMLIAAGAFRFVPW